jgi:hypothetical protein
MSLWRGFAAETGNGKRTKLTVLWEQNTRPETHNPGVFAVGGKANPYCLVQTGIIP